MSVLINDPYLDDERCIERLYKEYKKHNSLIIAFDLDGTINDFHSEGFEFPDLVLLIKKAKKLNCYNFCFTAHPNEDFVKEFLEKNEIPYDAINDSPVKVGMNNKKPYYNILLDDRAGLSSAYKILINVLNKIENELV